MLWALSAKAHRNGGLAVVLTLQNNTEIGGIDEAVREYKAAHENWL